MDETTAVNKGWNAPTEFLKTARAAPACARELEALGDAIVKAVQLWHRDQLAETLPDKPAARRAPGRCVVQVGPVALSFAWLPAAQQDVSLGELLVIVWHGQVGPRREPRRDSAPQGHIPSSAVQLWEGVFHAGVVGTDGWRWCAPDIRPEAAQDTAALAAEAVERLQAAYLAHAA